MIKKQLLWYFCCCQIIGTFWKILIVSSYLFPVEYEKRRRHLWKGQEKCCLGLHGYLFVGGDDNINAWLHMLEWNGTAKRKLKQEKRVLVTEINTQINLRIILKHCALQWWAQMLIETNGMAGWGKGGGWEGPVNNCCVSVLALRNLVFAPNINYDRGTCYP